MYKLTGKDPQDAWIGKATLNAYPHLYDLVPREVHILALNNVTEFPEQTSRTLDLGQSVGRDGIIEDATNAITPKGRKYLTSKCRFLNGIESLRLQSIWFKNERHLHGFNDRLLRNLAGNAFVGSCHSAQVFINIMVLAHGAKERWKHEQLSSSQPTGVSRQNAMDHIELTGNDSDMDDVWNVLIK